MERRILGEIEKNKWDSWGQVAKAVGGISQSSVQRTAHRNGIHRCIAIRKPFISQVNIEKRLVWAAENYGRNWDNVIFTDETKLELGEHSGPCYVSRRRNEHLDPNHIAPNFTSGRRSIMLWAAISYHGKSPLLELSWPDVVVGKDGKPKRGGFTNKQYAEQVLSVGLQDFYTEQVIYAGWDFEVVEDGALVHKGPFVREARVSFPFENLAHPPSSPDLNPIENIWHMLKRRIWSIQGAHNSLKNLKSAAREAWDSISQEEIRNVIDSMDRRVEAVVKAKGQATDY